MNNLRDKLTKELETVEWAAIVPHFERGGVVEIDQSLNLVDVGIAMANDNSEIVSAWLKDGLMTQPDEAKTQIWKSEKTTFQFLIVQPYVLIQKVALHS